MAAVTQRVVNYLSGVSKQPDSKKFPGQVRECINGLPDVTLGMTKRPGFKFISKLKNTSGTDFSGTQLDGAKWFHINRDATASYIGCITPKVGSTNGSIYIWNADTGAACTITNGSAHTYLTGGKANYDILTIQDKTIVTNNLVTVTALPAPTSFVAQSRGTILLSLLGALEASIQSTTFEVKLGGTAIVNEKGGIQTCTYTSGASDDYDDVLDGIKGQIDGKNITGLNVTKYGTSLQIDYVVSSTRTPFTLTAKGGTDNERITVYQDWASNESWLPNYSFHGQVVHIVNKPNSDSDDYYAKFVATNPSTGGEGYWVETIAPNVSTGLTASTMPHSLRNTGTNAFTFEPFTWEPRLVGDDLTNDHPSFVGKTITKAFSYNDRLGFLSEDNVILSVHNEPFRFYADSARTQSPSDPCDLNCASVRPTKLTSVVPARQGLVLFSKRQQFLLYNDDGPITPTSQKIRAISNMEMSDDVEPIDIGTHFNFISKTPNFVRVFAMQPKGLGESPEILDIGRVVNEWITIDVDTLVASIQNEFIAMSSQSSDEIYFYRTYSDGEEKLMESWFKWKLPGTVQAMALDQDDMYTVTKQGNQYTLAKANLTQSPEVAIITNAQGQKINPCMDLYAQATNGLAGGSERKVVWDAANVRSKCYIPYAHLTDKKNLVIVSGTTAAGTFNNSGYVVEAEVGTDSDGTFFIVPEQNLSTIASNVYVGYAYDFDLHLPQLYVDLGEKGVQPDFTANLTVSRCKFDVGLSGIMGFKLNATGRFAASKTYTMFKNNCKDNSGNDVYTDYEWSKPDLDYIDRNQIKVKINNKSTTDFTFQSDTKIRLGNSLLKQTTLNGDGTTKLFAYTFDIESTANIKVKVGGVLTTDFVFAGGKYISFNTAPPAATGNIFIYNEDELEIYMDEWYFLEPISNANTYLADDVPLDESRTVTIPIHQRNNNYSLRVFTDSPFPVSLSSMMWEGNYSPRFYRRT